MCCCCRYLLRVKIHLGTGLASYVIITKGLKSLPPQNLTLSFLNTQFHSEIRHWWWDVEQGYTDVMKTVGEWGGGGSRPFTLN